jgi:hypothetical protein
MKQKISAVAAIVVLSIVFGACSSTTRLSSVSTNQAKGLISGWPAKSQEVANTIMDKYGAPDEVTATMLVWHNNGPWKKTVVSKDPVPHNFPMQHEDLVEQFIDYQVPLDKYDDLARFDGSVIAERTKGVISARCDKEGANFLAINLAHDVATGNKTIEQARTYYAKAIKDFMSNGQMDTYMQGLKFEVPKGNTKDPDQKAPGM